MRLLLAWLSLWPALEPALPNTYDVVPEIVYKEVDGEALTAHLYLPSPASGPTPAVVFVHGGLWSWGDKRDYVDFAGRLAAEGIAAVLIDFRKNNGNGFGESVADIKDALRWVRAHGDAYRIDGGRIGLFGSSSGGHLAALVAYAGDGEGLEDDPPGTSSRVQSCFLLYGVYHLTESLPGLWQRVLVRYVGASAADDPALYDRWSPIHYIDGTEPPTLLMHGTRDILAPIAQAERLAEVLEGAGVASVLVPVEGRGHGFARIHRRTRPLVFDAMLEHFRATLE